MNKAIRIISCLVTRLSVVTIMLAVSSSSLLSNAHIEEFAYRVSFVEQDSAAHVHGALDTRLEVSTADTVRCLSAQVCIVPLVPAGEHSVLGSLKLTSSNKRPSNSRGSRGITVEVLIPPPLHLIA